MARSNNVKFVVSNDIYDPKGLLDENSFYNSKLAKPDELSRTLTWIMGDNKKRFPISMMTYGNVFGTGNFRPSGNVKELQDMQYTYPVMSRTDKCAVVSETLTYANVDNKPGVGNSQFKIRFVDNWIKRHYIIESPLGIQAYVLKDPDQLADGSYEYTVQLDPANADDFCPLSELTAGTLWADLYSANAESESRGTEFRRVAPGTYKNQMTLIRASHSWAGNVANRTIGIDIKIDDKVYNTWMDFQSWLFEEKWLEEMEHNYWYSRYNRKADGTIDLKDIGTGKVIPRGSGILEQIPNYHTYASLTYNKLQNVISDAMFGQSDTDNMTITLFTGKGGMREFDRAMKEYAVANTFLGGGETQGKFIGGSGYNLYLTGFFDKFYHIDGYVVKVKHNPTFDHGRRAMKSPRHPETGWPLESYRMVFLDDADYEGEPNIQHVTQKGRSFIEGYVAGMTPGPKGMGVGSSSAGAPMITTDQDRSSYHRLAVCGVQIKRATKCIHLECIRGID
jgi:hypothetical protein